MRSDAKLGLSLGMLVIGFAVAFCFPRQSEVSLWGVAPAEPIDEPEFDFLPIRAYQPARESENVPITVQASPADDSAQLSATDPGDRSLLSRNSEAKPVPPVAPPVRSLSEVMSLDLKMEAMVSEEVPTETPRPGPAGEPEQPSSPSPKIYQVRKGDTLTGIAIRLLGDSQRYREIYEANRDRLASPDDLRVGMELTIPTPTSSRLAANPQAAEESKSDEDSGEAADRENKKFRQAERAPFLNDGSRE
jgi:hypothetical protein